MALVQHCRSLLHIIYVFYISSDHSINVMMTMLSFGSGSHLPSLSDFVCKIANIDMDMNGQYHTPFVIPGYGHRQTITYTFHFMEVHPLKWP